MKADEILNFSDDPNNTGKLSLGIEQFLRRKKKEF